MDDTNWNLISPEGFAKIIPQEYCTSSWQRKGLLWLWRATRGYPDILRRFSQSRILISLPRVAQHSVVSRKKSLFQTFLPEVAELQLKALPPPGECYSFLRQAANDLFATSAVLFRGNFSKMPSKKKKYNARFPPVGFCYCFLYEK